MSKFDLFVTHEVENEIKYHYQGYQLYLNCFKILPSLNMSSRLYSERGFDKADISLLEYSELDDYIIVTEDEGMLSECLSEENNIIQLIDFLELLHRHSFLKRREIYHIAKYFRKIRNITERKEKKILLGNQGPS